ncbi:bifunctional phosphoribosyl-AMP cyclohydrolase/phosphoribosyl-ATP diphosphatase HisIE, partial [Vibrio genomosp. F10]
MSFNVSKINDLSERIDWNKVDGLVPAVVQDFTSGQVLMMGYMNQAALDKTAETQQVTFFSRTKERLWTKGETSGNVLQLVNISLDCDNDTLLVKANPIGPTCHTGTTTCWDADKQEESQMVWLHQLEQLLAARKDADPESSY